LAYKVVEEHINANEQVFMLLTGGGGTGKSHVIKALVHKARITWGKALGVYGSALVVAPTGNAAFNVRGHTWHSALSKTPSQKPLNLSKTMIERLVDRFMGLRLLILDEVSMVNLEDLAEISYRLGVAMKCPDKPFGGLHVVLAGDLYQLPPVSGTAMYAAVKLREKAITVQGRTLIDTHLNAFVELLENNRGDHTLTAVNEEIRQGVMSLRTQSLLRLRTKPDTATTAGEVHERAVWLAVTNKEVNQRNAECLAVLVNSGRVHFKMFARHLSSSATSSNPDFSTALKLLKYRDADSAAGAAWLHLAVGSRVSVTKNLATNIGLFNGARGTVVAFGFSGERPTNLTPTEEEAAMDNLALPIVFCQMDGGVDPNTGEKWGYTGDTIWSGVDRIVPFVPMASLVRLKGNWVRHQIPLRPCFAMTVHKSQSITAKEGVVFLPPARAPFAMGLLYVAISRTFKCLENLIILGRSICYSHVFAHASTRMNVTIKLHEMRTRFADHASDMRRRQASNVATE